MSTTKSMKEVASGLAERLKPKITHVSHKSYPWLFVPAEEDDRALVKDRWLKDKANLESVAETTGRSFKADPEKNIIEAYPIIWTERSGTLKRPFPKQHLVILALDDLHQNNGLPLIEGGGTLASGDYVVLSGDKDMRFNGKGGGLAFFILLSF